MWKYIIIVIVGALSYGPLQAFAKVAYSQGYSVAEITLVQAFFGAIILWIMMLFSNIKKRTFKFKGNWHLLLAGTSMGISAFLSYGAVQYIPVALGIVLLMQVSWISVFAEWLIFKKKPAIVEIVAIVIILFGTALATNLMDIKNFSLSMIGMLMGISAAIFYTIYVLFTSRLGNKTPMLQKSALMTTGAALMIFVINFKGIISSTNLDFGLVKWGGFLAFFGTVIPPICFTTGMPKIGAGLSSILLTLELPAVALCAYLVLGETLNFTQKIGIAVMIGAIILLNILKSRKEKQRRKTINTPNVFQINQ